MKEIYYFGRLDRRSYSWRNGNAGTGAYWKFQRVMKWADEVRTLKVRTNADTPHDAQAAVDFGAEGIGLCRTEHMF